MTDCLLRLLSDLKQHTELHFVGWAKNQVKMNRCHCSLINYLRQDYMSEASSKVRFKYEIQIEKPPKVKICKKWKLLHIYHHQNFTYLLEFGIHFWWWGCIKVKKQTLNSPKTWIRSLENTQDKHRFGDLAPTISVHGSFFNCVDPIFAHYWPGTYPRLTLVKGIPLLY